MNNKLRYIALSILSISLLSQAIYAADDLESRHIIDWHAHIAGLGYGESGIFINKKMRKNFRFNFFLSWMGVTIEELKTYGDQILTKRLANKIKASKYVDQAVILALDGVINKETGELDKEKTIIYVPNEFVAQETAKYQNLLFGASINPNRLDSIERLERVHKQGAVLIKWVPSIMDIDPADTRFIPFYRRMAQLNISLLSHTGMEKSFPGAKDELADPRRLELPLKTGVTVIAAHIATTGKSEGENNFERLLPMFKEFPNLYADISSLTQINKLGYLAKALRQPGVTERMIYGTDWPIQFFPLVSPWYHLRHIGLRNAWRISRIHNRWDRDIKLKEAFGVPPTVFSRRVGILNQPVSVNR